MRTDQAVCIQKHYRRFQCEKKYDLLSVTFQQAVWLEFLNDSAGHIQKLGRHYLGRQKRKYMQQLKLQANTLIERNQKCTVIQARLFRGPRDRRRMRMLKAIRHIQKYYRGYSIRMQTTRVWKTMGTLSVRPKPESNDRKVSFFGAGKQHLFSGKFRTDPHDSRLIFNVYQIF